MSIMCRLLAIRSNNRFDPNEFLKQFAHISKNSKEYQGHGWGISYLNNESWITYKNIDPIWDFDEFNFPKTTECLVHARSAFRNEGIEVDNNMPLISDDIAFIFNGELQKVRLNVLGNTGAKKIFSLIQKMKNGDLEKSLYRSIKILEKRADYIRALNLIISDKEKWYITNIFNEDSDYFTMHQTITDDLFIVSSEPFGNHSWQSFQNNTVMVIS